MAATIQSVLREISHHPTDPLCRWDNLQPSQPISVLPQYHTYAYKLCTGIVYINLTYLNGRIKPLNIQQDILL